MRQSLTITNVLSLIPAIGLLLLCGCTVGPDYRSPEVAMPDAWHEELTSGLMEGQADLQTWWLALEDPVLNQLLVDAGSGSLDLQSAVSRIRQARAQLAIASGQYYPTVGASGLYARERISENGLIPNVGLGNPTDFYNAQVDALWEMDVFGRISRSVEASQAFLGAAVENYRDVLVILYADTAITYIEVRSLQARIAYALENIKIQQDTLLLTRNRYEAGLVPELDVRQAELNLADTQSVVPELRSQETRALNRLSTLVGHPPGQLAQELLTAAPIPAASEELIVALPAELLRQRPDIRQSERLLAAQTAQVGVATADLYPNFSLFGVFALESRRFDEWGDWDSRAWSLGPQFRWNLFQGGRIRSNIRLEEERTQEAFLRYQQTILLALEEVEDAMVSYKEEIIRLEALERSVVAAKRSVQLVTELYQQGLTNFQNVLDSQRSLTQQQDKLAQSRGLVTQNLVQIYRALGGGWSIDAQPTEANAQR